MEVDEDIVHSTATISTDIKESDNAGTGVEETADNNKTDS